MGDGVWITGIICATIIIVSLIGSNQQAQRPDQT